MKNRTMIFIVDDDKLFAELLKDHLSLDPDRDVHILNTGEDCLKRLNDHPDIIILDYYLNSVFTDAANGLKILEAIRKLDKHVHVVMLSSQERYGIALQSIAKGAEQYVIKDTNSFKQIEEIVKQMH